MVVHTSNPSTWGGGFARLKENFKPSPGCKARLSQNKHLSTVVRVEAKSDEKWAFTIQYHQQVKRVTFLEGSLPGTILTKTLKSASPAMGHHVFPSAFQPNT